MKIGIDISQVVYQGTGTATYTTNLVKNLLALDSKNNYCLFGSSLREKSSIQAFVNGLEKARMTSSLWYIPPTFLDWLWNQQHIFPIENLIGKIDVFHSSDWTQPPTSAKKVTTVHDLVVYKYPETLHPKIVETQKRKLEWLKKECDLVIAVSESTKNDLVEILKIPESKIRVIYEAAPPEFLDYQKNKDKPGVVHGYTTNKYQLFNRKYLISIGTNEPRKNLVNLIKAYQLANLKNVDLVIVGNYGWGPELGKLPDNIHLLGYVPQEDLPDLLAGSFALVYPSLYEGFGLPVVEAMSLGTPVIISNVSSLPEVGGQAASYVDPRSVESIAEAIQRLFNGGEIKYENLRKDSLEQAKKFSWEKAAKETIKVYEELG